MDTIELERRDRVGWVWLNQPRRLNAINQTTLNELSQVFEDLGQDSSIQAIVLAARGLVFSAGFDVAWMTTLDSGTIAQGLAQAEAVYETIEACAKPVLAAIQGAAVGGGLLLTLVADLRLASHAASFGTPEVKIGIFPSLGLIPRLERLVGLGLARRMVLTGEAVSGEEAFSLGLVDRLLPGESLYTEAQALARSLAALPAHAVQLAKSAFAAARRPGYAEWERTQFAACWARPERQAAMEAFLSRR